MRRIFFIITILLTLISYASAQTGRLVLRGMVMKERKSIDDAAIRIYDGAALIDSTLSKNGGRYYISLPLNRKLLIQFYYKGFAPKNISLETHVSAGMESADYNKYMIISLEDININDLEKDLQPVVQFKFNPNGEMIEQGTTWQGDLPKVIPKEHLAEILPNKFEAAKKAQKLINDAKRNARQIEKKATSILDSARKEAYAIIYDAKQVGSQHPVKPADTVRVFEKVYIRDTIYVPKVQIKELLKERIIQSEKVVTLTKKQEALELKMKRLEVERLNAKAIRDSIRISEIDNMISNAIKEIDNLTTDIESAKEEIEKKQLQIEASELRNRNLQLTVWFVSSVALLVLVFFIIAYQNYKSKRRLADELHQKNEELLKLSTVVSETDNAVILFDLNGNLEWINKGFTRMYGFENEDLEKEKLDNIFLRQDRETSALHFEAVLDSSIQISFESNFLHKDGYTVWSQTTMTPILDEEGKVHKIAAIDSNITQIKNAESEIKSQKEKQELHNRMIQDSIKYAHTIQSAFLPTDADLNAAFKSFVINKPKDIVSGDFFWFSQQKVNGRNMTFVAAVDCTGHGVPGAFMSMIGNRLLSEIVTTMQIHDPAKILDRLDIEVQKALKQDTTENTDGMDVCLCRLENNDQGTEIVFSGAQRPLIQYISETEKVEKIKGDIKTAGGFLSSFINKTFTSHTVQAKKGDMIYLTSDGIFDQNGPDRRRFGSKRVNKMITEFAKESLERQKEEFLAALTMYQGESEQRDDITLLGIRI